jgi:hypothetical protein
MLHTESLSNILRLHSGSSHVIKVPFTAQPQPEVTWSYDLRHFHPETVVNLTSLTLSKVTREDAGIVKVALKNVFGECSYEVKVVVIGEKCRILLYRNLTITCFTVCVSRFVRSTTFCPSQPVARRNDGNQRAVVMETAK